VFEVVTFEALMQRMLDRVPADLDKRQGSILYNALAPAAAELQNMYIELDWVLKQSFADTATREYLVRRCAERGIVPRPASRAILDGRFNIGIPLGARFAFAGLVYRAVERIALGGYHLECETAGEIGNQAPGTLLPIDYIDGLTSAQVAAVLVPGEDEEGTEALRQRYFDSLEPQAFGGNISDYKAKVNALNGVGGVKVYPVWAGGGTVKLVIIDAVYGAPSAALIDAVQSAVDPVQNQGRGLGIAPVGHVVTVVGVNAFPVNIAAVITYAPGWAWPALAPYLQSATDTYFNELARTWADTGNLIVRVSQIETRALALAGVLDITGITLNGLPANLMLDAGSIPVRGALSG